MKIGMIVKILNDQDFDKVIDELKIGDYALVTNVNGNGFEIYVPRVDNSFAWFRESSVEIVGDSLELYR